MRGRHHAALRGQAEQKAKRGVASTQRTSVKVHQDESLHGWRDCGGTQSWCEMDTGEANLARVCRCRIVWRRPENQRWDRKLLTEMNGEPRNTLPRQEEKLQIKDRECIALKHSIKCGSQRGGMACCEHAGSNLRDLRARTQDIVDNEVVQADSQRKFERLTKKPTEQFEQGTVQSSTGGTAMAVGRPAPGGQPNGVGCSC